MRLDTVSLRGLFNQHIHGSKRSLRSVEDFTEFEQRTAYFNGDEIHAIKKGMNILDRIHGDAHGPDAEHARLPARAQADRPGPSRSGRRPPRASCAARSCFSARRSAPCAIRLPPFSTTRCTICSVERFLKGEAGDGPIKSFTLRGIKDSPPYLHDGRCLTLEDTVEFFNLVLA